MKRELRLILFSIISVFMSFVAHGADGVTENEVVIGESTNETGLSPERSVEATRGAGLVFDKINAQGGVAGRKLKIVNYDDAYSAQKTVENVRKLLTEDHAFLLFQIYGTTNVSAIMPIVERDDVPLLFPLSGAENLRSPVRANVFNSRLGYNIESEEMMRFAVEKRGIREIAVFYQNDGYGLSGLAGVQRALEKFALKRTSKGSYERSTLDVAAAIKEISISGAKAVLIWGTPKQSALFVKQSFASGFKPLFVLASPAMSSEFVKILESTPADVVVTENIAYLQRTDEPLVQSYQKDAKASGIPTSSTSFEGYVNATILVEGLRIAGKDLTRKSFRAALEGMRDKNLGGYKVSFSTTNHQAFQSGGIYQLKDGKPTVISEHDSK